MATNIVFRELLDLVKAVKIIEHAPYSHEGQWIFRAHPSLSQTGSCPTCRGLANAQVQGEELGDMFPYHEHAVEDPKIILAKVHPNCSCSLEKYKSRAPPQDIAYAIYYPTGETE